MSLQPLVPHDYQEGAIQQILRDKQTLVYAGVGSGKTLVGVEAMLRAETDVNLIVAPLNTFRGWQKTLQRQGGKELQFIDARKAGKEAHQQLALGIPGYYFMGTERMRTQAWASWKLDFVIIDECHKLSNRKSKTFKMAKTMKALYRVGLSATPAGNKVEGLYAVGKWHWPKTIPNSFVKWAQEYLYPEYNPFSQFNDWGAEREPGAIMRDFPSVARMPSTYTDKPAIHDVMVELNPTQRKVYKQLEGEAIAFLEDNSLMVVDLPSTLYIRLIETTLATPSVEKTVDPETGEVKDTIYFKPDAKSSKADALLEILGDLPPQPVLVFTHSRKFAEFLTQRLVSRNYSAKAFVGGLPPQERFDLIDNFGVSYDIMVATIPAVGEGTDGFQHKCATEVWCSVSDNNVLNTQAKGRLSRQGQENLVNRFVLRAQGTVEEKQAGRLAVDMQILEESLDNVEA